VTPAGTTHREVLRAPLSWWVVGLGIAGLAAATLHSGAGGWRSVVPYLVLPVCAVAVLVALSRQRIVVADGVLHVPGARAPLTAFGPVEVLDRRALREWRGLRAHRDAWVRVKPWATGAVRLPVTDPDDDTPYWLVGTRHPVDLAVAVTVVRDTL
jgi:hypothetical protein